MRTGNYIEMMYAIEIQRIVIESEYALKEVVEEPEIFNLQKRLKIHDTFQDGCLKVAFMFDGTIEFRILDKRKGEQINIQTENIKKSLEGFHISILRQTHPKKFRELLIRASKKILM